VWRFPLQPAGLVTLAAAGGVIYLLGLLGGWGERIGVAILWSYVFSLVRKTASGASDPFEPPDFSDLGDLIGPALRGAVATAVLWVPTVAWLWLSAPPPPPEPAEPAADILVLPDGTELERLRPGALRLEGEDVAAEEELGEADGVSDTLQAGEDAEASETAPADVTPETQGLLQKVRLPVVGLLILLGILWAPAALMLASSGGSLLQMLNPLRPVGFILRIPRDYAVAVGAMVVLAVVGLLLRLFGQLVSAVPIPILPTLAATILSVYTPLVAGRVLGLLLFVRGAEVGYLPEDEAYEPALPGVEPRGVDRSTHKAPATDAVTALRQALQGGAPQDVVQLYRTHAALMPLPPDVHLEVGRVAAGLGDFPLAVHALKASAGADPQSPSAPRAFVLLARVVGERMGDVAGAQRIYAHVVKHYPDSEAARFARQRLTPSG
jgi:hypothetical protein